MAITLREITEDNFYQCIDLEVTNEQKNFVAPNVYSIAESKIYPEATIKAIYKDEEIVGFMMFGRNNEKDDTSPWLIRFMIDQRYQGKGYGKAAMNKVLDLMTSKYPNETLCLSTDPDNINAIAFYETFGFENTGLIQHDELVFKKG